MMAANVLRNTRLTYLDPGKKPPSLALLLPFVHGRFPSVFAVSTADPFGP